MNKILSTLKGFLVLSLLMSAMAFTTAQAQTMEPVQDGPKGGCPGGWDLDFNPEFEAVWEAERGGSNQDGWVCLKVYKRKGEPAGYRIFDNTF